MNYIKCQRNILKRGMQQWGLQFYKVYVHEDPRLTVTHFTARSNLVAFLLNGKNCYKVIKWEELAVNDQIDRKCTCMFMKNIRPKLSAPVPGLYTCTWPFFQTFSLKPFSRSKPNLM